jgi:transposase
MVQVRRKFDDDFKIGAVRIVRESGKPIAQVARELGVNDVYRSLYGLGGLPTRMS